MSEGTDRLSEWLRFEWETERWTEAEKVGQSQILKHLVNHAKYFSSTVAGRKALQDFRQERRDPIRSFEIPL